MSLDGPTKIIYDKNLNYKIRVFMDIKLRAVFSKNFTHGNEFKVPSGINSQEQINILLTNVVLTFKNGFLYCFLINEDKEPIYIIHYINYCIKDQVKK